MNRREEIMKSVKTMPSMPLTIIKLGNLLSDPHTELEEIIKVIQYDPGFTANVLKLANSAALGFPRQVGSLKEALVRIGTHKVFQITVAGSLRQIMNQSLSGYDLNAGDFWRHCIAVAVAAESIAALSKKVTGDSFTAGLLHDIGKLVISNFLKGGGDGLLVDCPDVLTFDLQEKCTLGINHAEAGAMVIKGWNFPEALVNAVEFHHAPADKGVLADVVHVADALCISAGIGNGADGLQYQLFPDAVERLELTHETIEIVLSQTLEKMEKFEGMLV